MKTSILPILALFVCLGTFFATPARSQILITRSPDAPLESHSAVRIKVPDESASTRYMMKWWDTRSDMRASRHRETGQTFSLSGTEPVAVEGFTFRLNLGTSEQVDGEARTAGEVVTLSIYEVSGTNSAIPVGAALYSGTGTLPTGMLVNDYLTFTLPDTFEAAPGTQYSVQIGFQSYSGSNQMSFATGPGALYGDGTGFLYQNPAGSADLEYDSYGRNLDFAVLYTPVPEASTAGVLLTSFLLLIAFNLNRRRSARAVIASGIDLS